MHLRTLGALAASLSLLALPASSLASVPLQVSVQGQLVVFADVPSDAWFASYVQQAAESGIVSGYADAQGNLTGKFGPADSVTVAQALKMAVQASGYDAQAALAGCGQACDRDRGQWYAPYMAVAAAQGLDVFAVDPNGPADRDLMAYVTARLFQAPSGQGAADPFTDVSASDSFVLALSRDQVMTGDTDASGRLTGTFRPRDSLNRAEAAKIVVAARAKYGTPGTSAPPLASSEGGSSARDGGDGSQTGGTRCIAPDCPVPPKACRYERPVDLDANGCPSDCGRLVCGGSSDDSSSAASSSSADSCTLDQGVGAPEIADDGSVVYATGTYAAQEAVVLRSPDGTRTAVAGPGTPLTSAAPLAFSRDGRTILLMAAYRNTDPTSPSQPTSEQQYWIEYDTATRQYTQLMPGMMLTGESTPLYGMSDDGKSVVYRYTKPGLKKDSVGRQWGESCALLYDVSAGSTKVLAGSGVTSCLTGAKNPDTSFKPVISEDQIAGVLISRTGNVAAIVTSQSTFNTNPAGLYLLNLQTMTARLVASNVDGWVLMSDDGRFISYMDNSGLSISILDTSTGTKTRLDDIPGFQTFQIYGMSADGQKVILQGRQQAGGATKDGDFLYDRTTGSLTQVLPNNPAAGDPIAYSYGFLTSDASEMTYPCGGSSTEDQALCIQSIPGPPAQPLCEP